MPILKRIDINKLPLKNLVIVCLTVVCIYSIRGCSNKSLEIERMEYNWKVKFASIQKTVNDKNQEIATQGQVIMSEKRARELALIENKELKKINSEVKVKTNTIIREVPIPYNTASAIVSDVGDTVRVSSNIVNDTNSIKIESKWYGLYATIGNTSMNIDSLYFVNELVTTIGYKKPKGIKNLFKASEPVVQVVNKNPYTSVESMSNVIIENDKKRFYQTRGFYFGLGLLGGYLIVK